MACAACPCGSRPPHDQRSSTSGTLPWSAQRRRPPAWLAELNGARPRGSCMLAAGGGRQNSRGRRRARLSPPPRLLPAHTVGAACPRSYRTPRRPHGRRKSTGETRPWPAWLSAAHPAAAGGARRSPPVDSAARRHPPARCRRQHSRGRWSSTDMSISRLVRKKKIGR